MKQPRMFYFGPYREAGHRFHEAGGYPMERRIESEIPWSAGGAWCIDGGLAPSTTRKNGIARLTLSHGWTALSFWDQAVDERPGSHSTYVAEGIFTFQQMVDMAKERFSERWDKMKFPVTEMISCPTLS